MPDKSKEKDNLCTACQETCVVEEIKNGNLQIVDEAVDLIKKLK